MTFPLKRNHLFFRYREKIIDEGRNFNVEVDKKSTARNKTTQEKTSGIIAHTLNGELPPISM